MRAVSYLLMVVLGAGLWAHPARSEGKTSEIRETHCVVHVLDQAAGGELMLSPATCFSSLRDAMSYASGGSATDSQLEGLTGPALLSDPAFGETLSTFTLGTHFDGTNGTGSSISVVGGSCTGGYWNTGAAWANRISSSWNGCYRLRHYDGPNKTGAWADTTGVGQTDNLPSILNNKTESVAYYGS